MREDIKGHLDASIPNHITLTEAQKSKIMREAPNRTKKSGIQLQLMPLIVSIATISLSFFLVIPYIQDWLEKDLTQLFEQNLVEVTITDVEYANLIRSIYVEDSKEMVYSDWNGIYSYLEATNTKEILIDPKEESKIHLFTVNENWLAWEEITTSTLNILNRNSNELLEIPNITIADLQLQDNTLIYMNFSEGSYKAIDLSTMDQREIHELTGNGSSSLATVYNNLLVVPEEIEKEGETRVKFYLYDIKENTRVGEYEVPYEMAQFVTLTDNKIFAQLSNEDENVHLGYIDLESGKLHEIKVPPFSEYAVFEDYVALSINVKDATTVKLYQIEDNELKELPAFKNISERLVRPRFTEEGTLVVNGEGEQRKLYLQGVNFEQ